MIGDDGLSLLVRMPTVWIPTDRLAREDLPAPGFMRGVVPTGTCAFAGPVVRMHGTRLQVRAALDSARAARLARHQTFRSARRSSSTRSCSVVELVDLFTSDGIEFHGQVSFLKAGIRYSDRLTTVSPSYAREILTPEFGCGLDGLLRARASELKIGRAHV